MEYETLTEAEWSQVDRAWELLDDGKVAEARAEVDNLYGKRPGHADLRIIEAALQIEEGQASRALQALQGAERSADPALFFYLRARASFDLCNLDAARSDAERSLTIRGDFAETRDLLSRTLEQLGDAEGAREQAEIAAELDHDRFPLPLDLEDAEFDRLVEKSLGELPERIRAELDRLPVFVEDLPRLDLLKQADPPLPPDLLGLFAERDLFARSVHDLPQAPGAIYLFRRNLLRFCHDLEDLEREIRITVQHEVGHLFGGEERLDEWGLA
jgi:predicted Zn-dependent protease with MMP-like domain